MFIVLLVIMVDVMFFVVIYSGVSRFEVMFVLFWELVVLLFISSGGIVCLVFR